MIVLIFSILLKLKEERVFHRILSFPFFLKSELTFRSGRIIFYWSIQQWCSFTFFHFLLLSSKLAEGIKRGERKRVSLRVFPMIFQLSFHLPAADRNPFLARDHGQEKENFMEWSSAFHPSRYTSLPPPPSSWVSCPVSFLVLSPPIRSTPERSSFCYPRGLSE